MGSVLDAGPVVVSAFPDDTERVHGDVDSLGAG
jgi:hypothetical protein